MTDRIVESETELDASGEAMICEGCGTTRTIAAILARHGPKAVACCPERKMVPARWYWKRALEKNRTDLLEEAEAALEGMIAEFDKFTRYGSPIAAAANERVAYARATLAKLNPSKGGK